MKLLRSTFVAFCMASSASGFAPQISSRSAAATSRSTPISSSSLFVGIHEQPASQISEDVIRDETMFIQVLKEVGTAKEYLSWLIEESGASAEDSAEEEGKTFADVVAEKAEAGEVELFGGGGDAAPGSSDEKETAYRPALRSDLGSTVLVSGTADSDLLNILNNNFWGQDLVPNFEFTTIKALVDDVPAAKKKAISRVARYGGLLDKLAIEPASGELPSEEDMAGVSSWIVQLESEEDAKNKLPKIGALAKDCADLKNVMVLVLGSTSSSIEGWDEVEAASADGDAFKCTLLSVGEIYDDGKEGGFYHIAEVGEESAMITPATPPRLTRKKAYQLVAHAMSLDSTANKALAAYEYHATALGAIAAPYSEGEFVLRDEEGEEMDDKFHDVKMEGRMIQGMREMGFTQVMELDVLVDKGLPGFKKYIENPPNKENAFAQRKSARDEEDERLMAILDADIAKSQAEKQAEAEKQKTIDIEGIAKEWAIKEYSLRMLGGDLDDAVTENEFMVSAWGEALAEAERTYARINSEEYIKEQERLEKSKANTENKLFWDGMPPVLRKKREKMVEKVKKQYMDLLSEEDLERIILNE